LIEDVSDGADAIANYPSLSVSDAKGRPMFPPVHLWYVVFPAVIIQEWSHST
jgi:hypothetical protein